MISRRSAIRATVLTGAALVASGQVSSLLGQAGTPGGAAFSLPPLPYAPEALEPHLDAETMKLHHDKHHAAYVKKLNEAVAQAPSLQGLSVEKILADLAQVPEPLRQTVRDHGGGHANHTLFWQMMSPRGGGEPTGALAQALTAKFGSVADFRKGLNKAAAEVFGSGWAWLVLEGRELAIVSTPNQDSPISAGRTPLLGVDVWEHAYYLKHQNRRPEYLEAWWKVVNWDFVAERFRAASA